MRNYVLFAIIDYSLEDMAQVSICVYNSIVFHNRCDTIMLYAYTFLFCIKVEHEEYESSILFAKRRCTATLACS